MLLNAAPPCALVVPEPLSVPPDKVEAPVTASVPLPLKSPPDCVSVPTVVELLRVAVPLESVIAPATDASIRNERAASND